MIILTLWYFYKENTEILEQQCWSVEMRMFQYAKQIKGQMVMLIKGYVEMQRKKDYKMIREHLKNSIMFNVELLKW